MKENKISHDLKYFFSIVLCSLILWGNDSRAALFRVDTTSVTGQTGQIVFDFIDGGLPDNSFTLNNFNFGLGSSVGSVVLTGGVTGDVSSNFFFQDSMFFNEVQINLTFGNQVNFFVASSTNLPPDLSSFPDAFSVFLLDTTGRSLISTSDPTGSDSLFRWDFGTDPTTNIFSEIVTISAPVVVPEPNVIFLLFAGIGMWVLSRFLQRDKKGI